jgi:putative membrane protein
MRFQPAIAAGSYKPGKMQAKPAKQLLLGSAAHACQNRPMHLIADVLVALVALLHVYFLVLEMFLWDKPAGLRAFGQTLEAAQASRVLAANQGLYNGFLAAGLMWGLVAGDLRVKVFFLACVLVAGLFGAATASRKILFVQALPAAIALALVLLAPAR